MTAELIRQRLLRATLRHLEDASENIRALAQPATPAQDAHTPREQPQTLPGGTESGQGRDGAVGAPYDPDADCGVCGGQRDRAEMWRRQANRDSSTIARVRALATETGHDISCGGLSVTDHGCYAGDLARRILETLDGAKEGGA